MRKRFFALLAFAIVRALPAFAQFAPAFVQNSNYWNDGKAEFDIYDAQLVRYGQPRQTEVLHILVREPFDLKQLVKPDYWRRRGVIQVLKMNQILHVPDRSLRLSANALQLLAGRQRAPGEIFPDQQRQLRQHLQGSAPRAAKISPTNGTPTGMEWPTAARESRFRLTDFSTMSFRCGCARSISQNRSGDFEIQLAPTIINSKKDNLVWKPAQVNYESTRKSDLRHGAARRRDRPLHARPRISLSPAEMGNGRRQPAEFEAKPEGRLLELQQHGDRKRALLSPILQHPD